MKFKKISVLAFLFFAFALVCASGLTKEQKQQLNITQKSQKIRAKGNLPLYFFDAVTAEPIKNVSVKIEDGDEYFSDKYGFVTLPKLDDGEYEIAFSAPGYISEEQSFSVKAGFMLNYRFAMSQMLVNKKFRIVLQWGERPADLDLHFEKEGGYHISYRDMKTSEDGSANLDHDDIDSYGPETITVNETADGTNYFVYIVDYTNHDNATSSALSSSDAVVKIYGGENLLACFEVPKGKRGNRWNVCAIADGKLTENNTVVTNY